MKSICHQLGAVAGVLLLAEVASAASVTFSGSAISFTPGSGYGTESGEVVPPGLPGAGTPLPGGMGGTLLDVVFAASGATPTFVLAGVGSSKSGEFGTVQLRERFIDSAETDGLSVTADITATMPVSGLLHVSATGTATVGIVPPLLGEAPGVTDLTITWTPLIVPFGAGGAFRIDMDTLSFDTVTLPPSGDGTFTLPQTATVTLLAVPVPEPETFAMMLAGLALVCWVAARRHRIWV